MEDIQYIEITAEEVYNSLYRYMKSEKVAFKLNDGTKYIGAIKDNMIRGCVRYMRMKNGDMRYKTDYVLSEHRGNGIYHTLCDYREATCIESERITAFCTEMSLRSYLMMGFKKISVSDSGITFVEKSRK